MYIGILLHLYSKYIYSIYIHMYSFLDTIRLKYISCNIYIFYFPLRHLYVVIFLFHLGIEIENENHVIMYDYKRFNLFLWECIFLCPCASCVNAWYIRYFCVFEPKNQYTYVFLLSMIVPYIYNTSLRSMFILHELSRDKQC